MAIVYFTLRNACDIVSYGCCVKWVYHRGNPGIIFSGSDSFWLVPGTFDD
jgi:hypothetical protein